MPVQLQTHRQFEHRAEQKGTYLHEETTNAGRLVVVSNRLPFTLKQTPEGWSAAPSSGGLATAMGPLLARTGGIWIGWSGDSSGAEADEGRQQLLAEWAEQKGFHAVELSEEIAHGFYEGFSNQSLWSLFHSFPFLLKFAPEYWQAYCEANRRFCAVVLKHLQPGDTVWIHDYQLMLLPAMLRAAAPDARIGFFLHIPFPASDTFRLLPRREEVLQGMLGADYLAFHTHGYLQNFRTSAHRILGLPSEMDKIEVGGRTTRLDALPIGIAPEEFTKLLDEDEETRQYLGELRERYKERRILLGVDRLDYTKGLPERLRTFRRLLEQQADLRGAAVLIQVAVPSREGISEYQDLRQEVDELIGQINGDFSTPDWTPVVYIRRAIPRSELAALYAAAEVAVVTPLRDGLNLVAKEYVACQRGQGGVLVLSEFAGAAAEMGEAYLVNPYDEERTAETLADALAFSADEDQHERMRRLYQRVTDNNVFAWADRFLANLRATAAESAARRAVAQARPLPFAETVAAFAQAQSKLLLLDYDGTLVGFANRPRAAVPPVDLLPTLAQLAAAAQTTVVIISGRARADLERWFGQTAGLWLAAEHGAIVRAPTAKTWERQRPDYTDDWKEAVGRVLAHFVARTPGSFVETKEFSLVWHYRMADPEFGEWLAHELAATLEQMLAETELRALHGHKIVEVKPLWVNKGEVLARLNHNAGAADFCFAAGDDRTDEDLFARLPGAAWTVHVGRGASRARYCLDDPAALRQLLHSFAATQLS